MKTKILTGINAVIAAILGGMGLTGCSPNVAYGVPYLEYGCPYVSLDVSGTITDEANQPLKDIQVQVSLLGYTSSPIYSDKNGTYLRQSNEGAAKYVDIVVRDTAGVYASDSVRVDIERVMYDQPKGWKEGEATAHQDFQLKKNN